MSSMQEPEPAANQRETGPQRGFCPELRRGGAPRRPFSCRRGLLRNAWTAETGSCAPSSGTTANGTRTSSRSCWDRWTAMWMASVAFDGARGFDGCAPDLDRHCARLIDSTRKMLLEPTMTAEEVEQLCREALRRLPRDLTSYIRPMFYAMRGFVTPEPVHDLRARGLRVADARAGDGVLLLELPASGARCGADRRQGELPVSEHAARPGRGLPARLRQRDHLRCRGQRRRAGTANLWIAKDGVAMTPVCNGTFLNGITRQRVLQLLRTMVSRRSRPPSPARTSSKPTRCSRPATTARCCRSPGWRSATTRRGASTRRRALYFEFARAQPVA